MARETNDSQSADKTDRSITVEWKRTDAESKAGNQQDDALGNHQPAEPGDDSGEFPGPEGERQVPKSHQRERATNHPQPVIEHRVVSDGFRAHALRDGINLRPGGEHSNHTNNPAGRGESQE